MGRRGLVWGFLLKAFRLGEGNSVWEMDGVLFGECAIEKPDDDGEITALVVLRTVNGGFGFLK